MPRAKKTNTEIPITNKKESSKESIFDNISMEDMQKMFMIFKQFENMQKQNEENETKNIKKNVKQPKNEHLTKYDLEKIRDEKIEVRSAVVNLTFKSPVSHIAYHWLEKGNVEILPISEILAMENSDPRFLHTPWVTVTDERVIEALNLKHLYELISKVEDIDNLITMSSEDIEKIFKELPKSYKDNFKDAVYFKIQNKELRDIVTIKALNDILGVNLLEN